MVVVVVELAVDVVVVVVLCVAELDASFVVAAAVECVVDVVVGEHATVVVVVAVATVRPFPDDEESVARWHSAAEFDR